MLSKTALHVTQAMLHAVKDSASFQKKTPALAGYAEAGGVIQQ